MEEPLGSSQEQMILRLNAIFDLLERGDTHLSRILGYANASTIHKVRRGLTFIGPERLAKLAELDIEPGYFPNLHWIITGEGSAVCGSDVGRSADDLRLTAAAESAARDRSADIADEKTGQSTADRGAFDQLYRAILKKIEDVSK